MSAEASAFRAVSDIAEITSVPPAYQRGDGDENGDIYPVVSHEQQQDHDEYRRAAGAYRYV